MNLELFKIESYAAFLNYIRKLRTAEYTLGQFLVLLIELPRKTMDNHLLRLSRESNFELRCEYLYFAPRLVGEKAMIRCVELLYDQSHHVRTCALLAINYLVASCEESVIRMLEFEQDGNARYEAVRLLGDIGTFLSIPMLERISTSDVSVNYENRKVACLAKESIEKIRLLPIDS